MPFSKKWQFFAYFKPGRNTGGFSLIEIVLSLFVILAIITILLTTSATYNTSRRSNLQGVAGKIATRRIETLRNTTFASVTTGSFTDDELEKLQSSTATQTVSSYQESADIKLATLVVSWAEGGVSKSITMDTLIYKNGL